MTTTSEYWEIDDLDMLASDLDTSLSGLGGGPSSTLFDMSEALSVLQVLKTENDSKERSMQKDMSSSLSKLDSQDYKESPSFTTHKTSSKTIKKPCRKKSFENLPNHTDTSGSPEHCLEDSSLLRVASAPLLSHSLYKSSYQPSLLLEDDVSSGFQYILAAPTAIGTKISDEMLTYLNQAQPYEIRLKKLNGLVEMKGKVLKSIMRVGFQERRLQFREKLEIFGWQNQRPWDRILDIDLALSYGIFDVKTDQKDINYGEFTWHPTREASVFIKINCISTEFTSKRKGGEKGVVFRIIIETFCEDKKHHSASCLIKVFKAKGADRKHKTDREKLEKLPQSEQRDIQPSYQYTVFTELPVQNDDESYCKDPPPREYQRSNSHGSERSFELQSPSHNEATQYCSLTSLQHSKNSQFQIKEEEVCIQEITSESSTNQVSNWLIHNRFASYVGPFTSFNGSDLLRLSREDVIEICGIADGIRFYNALHSKSVRPKLMVYFSAEGQTFHAIGLQLLTVQELKRRLCEMCQLKEQNLQDIFVVGPSDILIYLTDSLVSSMKNESIYIFEVARVEDENMCIILQPYCCNQGIPANTNSCCPPANTNM